MLVVLATLFGLTAVATVASLQATEALKILVGRRDALSGGLQTLEEQRVKRRDPSGRSPREQLEAMGYIEHDDD